MQSLLYFLIISVLGVQECFCMNIVRNRREIEKYPTRYDNIDVDSILASERLLKNYMNCLLDKGSCSPEGKLLRRESFLFHKSISSSHL